MSWLSCWSIAASWLGENEGPGAAAAPAVVEAPEPALAVPAGEPVPDVIAAGERVADPVPAGEVVRGALPAGFEPLPEPTSALLPAVLATALPAVLLVALPPLDPTATADEAVLAWGVFAAGLDDPAPVPHAPRTVPTSTTSPALATIRRDVHARDVDDRDVHALGTPHLLDFARSQ